ncbi:hypothetical protein [Pseudomonas sp. PH1b]|uniref:hypothetical protein n=1 Tax=Pseudomonas sp. PH1b TaxID=1397282 RepID=UPI000469F561|nr:hypothetical protein [Pseudomonas sp. PH1b]
MSKTLIEFQDHHQDFLVWTVDEEGFVTESRPYQTDVWGGCKVTNLTSLKSGDLVEYSRNGRAGCVRHPVRSVLQLIPIEISVRQDWNGYVTSTVHGKRVSCTYDYEYPVKRLAEKLFPERPSNIERLECVPTGRLHSKWRITPEGA